MYTLDDTIVAISTSIGDGGIGIVRLSGPESLSIVRAIFRPASDSWRSAPEPGRLYYGHVLCTGDEHVVDEVLVSYMRAPHTYTRQDVVEINAHGGVVALQEILGLCLSQGARSARRGEFTLRAFVNGRLDLAQAEAVRDIVAARTGRSLGLAVDQLAGRLSARVKALRADLFSVLAYLEARIDFSEDDILPQDIGPNLEQVRDSLLELLADAERGIIIRQGVRVAILGRPNVGKSSLLNALLRVERAIVTPIPGTTRDTLEESIDLNGIPLILVDTAGIGDTVDEIEKLGIERSRASAAAADLLLLVVDGTVAPTPEDRQVAALCAGGDCIVAVNKQDLSPEHDYADVLPSCPHVALSAKTGQGLDRLEARIESMVFSGHVTAERESLVSNPRHRSLLQSALASVEDALISGAAETAPELLSIDVTEAISSLGEITGETASEDLLDTIFASFCIGK